MTCHWIQLVNTSTLKINKIILLFLKLLLPEKEKFDYLDARKEESVTTDVGFGDMLHFSVH